MCAQLRRRWFAGKGDVWRLLQDLGDTIDGRSWPEDQAVEVRAAAVELSTRQPVFSGLLRHLTGVHTTGCSAILHFRGARMQIDALPALHVPLAVAACCQAGKQWHCLPSLHAHMLALWQSSTPVTSCCPCSFPRGNSLHAHMAASLNHKDWSNLKLKL